MTGNRRRGPRHHHVIRNAIDFRGPRECTAPTRRRPLTLQPTDAAPSPSPLRESNRARRQARQVRARLNPSPGGEQLCAASRAGVKVLAASSPSPWGRARHPHEARHRLLPLPVGEHLCAASRVGVRGLPVPVHPRESNCVGASRVRVRGLLVATPRTVVNPRAPSVLPAASAGIQSSYSSE